ncbi:MAG: DUF4345 domain-containing protein [Pseudomonadota bacterium]
MTTKFAKTQLLILFIAGALLVLVGGYILAAPTSFYASNNIELGTNISLINELKAPAGMLMVAGLFMLVAIFVRSLVDSATWLAALIFVSYATSRLSSMVFDGTPASGLVQAAMLEGIVGVACLTILWVRGIPTKRRA